jgi:hypothetical protein
MKLDYKILWLDDKIHEFIEDEFIDDIEEHLIEEGFNPIIDTTNNQEKFNKLLDDSYDLILTDFHLNENNDNSQVNGDTIVNEIRATNIFTEILFYTAKADLKGSLSWDRISFLQTEKLPDAHHEEVIKKVKTLIDLTVKKFQDIVVMRGMIMDETSDLDNQKIKLIKKYIDNNTNETISSLKIDILTEIDKHLSSKLKKVNGDWTTKEKGFKDLIKDDFVFSASYKIKTLGWILNQLSESDFSNDYKDEIINIRNIFAHAILEEDKDENGKVIRKYFKRGDMTFNPDKCKEIRKNITKHRKNLGILEDKLNTQKG